MDSAAPDVKIGQPFGSRKELYLTGSKDIESNNKPRAPSVFKAPGPGNYAPSGFVHCSIVRDSESSSSKLHPRFNFVFQIGRQPVSMVAEKQPGSRYSNYYMFDTSRGGATGKLTKKAGHYIGKLRREGSSRGTYVLYDAKEVRDQVAAYVYHVPSLVAQWKDGQPPRKLEVAVPILPQATEPAAQQGQCMAERLKDSADDRNGLVVLDTREPSYEGGQYRLNFGGRVTVPSVKNMQIQDENGEIIAQFGKIAENRFHLDFKAPMTAFQAFGMALTQFDL